jgi:hypothetical protein
MIGMTPVTLGTKRAAQSGVIAEHVVVCIAEDASWPA